MIETREVSISEVLMQECKMPAIQLLYQLLLLYIIIYLVNILDSSSAKFGNLNLYSA